MKNRAVSKVFVVLSVMLLLCGTGCDRSVISFNYPVPNPPEGQEGLSFYNPPASDEKLSDVTTHEVHNIILCIGDGMGYNHVAFARSRGVNDGNKLYMELLPVSGQVTTFSANDSITDSAAAVTATACGVKTNNGMLGMTPDQTCYSSILELLQEKGWRSGLVVTSQITHATPAGFSSHIDSRNKQKEIAKQLLDNRIDVMFGGGRKYWSDELLTEAAGQGYQVIETRDEILALKPEPVIGLFADDGMKTFAPEPSLAEMSQTAIGILSSRSREWFAPKPKFFLMIEGSQIDWACHANDTEAMVRQTLLFDMAVREAIEFAKRDRHTLVIVTADHETGGLQLKTQEGQMSATWTTDDHTGVKVPIYAYGPGADEFSGSLDNTDIAKRLAALTGIAEFPVIHKTLHIPETVSSE